MEEKYRDFVRQYYSYFLQTYILQEEKGAAYLLSSDSAVTIDRSGFIKAKAEHTFWGMEGQVLSLIEIMDTRECTQYVSPILYNGELCKMVIQFDYDHSDGEIGAILPMEADKQVYQLAPGDTIVPLYPYEILDETKTYEETYFQGSEIKVTAFEEGDILLEKIELEREQCWYGFFIRDITHRLSYSELVN